MDTQANVKLGGVIARSWSDEAYKAKLMGSPIETLKEAGINVPDGNNVRVVEQSAGSASGGNGSVVSKEGDDFVLTLPMQPTDSDWKVEDEQLEAAAGGICCCCSSCWTF